MSIKQYRKIVSILKENFADKAVPSDSDIFDDTAEAIFEAVSTHVPKKPRVVQATQPRKELPTDNPNVIVEEGDGTTARLVRFKDAATRRVLQPKTRKRVITASSQLHEVAAQKGLQLPPPK